jgi:WD40 repeat protein
MASFPLKWKKNEYTVNIDATTTPLTLMQQVEQLTGVPVDNQKLMAKKGWKGVLAIDTKLKVKPGKTTLSLMGSITATIAATTTRSPSTVVKFEEDISPQEKAAYEKQQYDTALLHSEGNIPAMQLSPVNDARNDGKAISYRYNYFCTGLPQKRIETLLVQKRTAGGNRLLGELVMTLGVELGKAFTTCVSVFPSGVVLSGRDDGRLQLWQHGERIAEMHQGDPAYPSPVTCSASVGDQLATGGSGIIRLWDDRGSCISAMRAPQGTNPRKIVSIGIEGEFAVLFSQATPFDPNSFRLPPQNEAQLQRRDAAIQERRRQIERFTTIACGVTLIGRMGGGGNVTLYPWETRIGGSAPAATSLAYLKTVEVLFVGDSEGGLRSWRHQHRNGNWAAGKLLQLVDRSSNNSMGISIIALEILDQNHHPGVLAVSTAPFAKDGLFAELPPGRLSTQHEATFLTVTQSSDQHSSFGSVVLIDVIQSSIQVVLQGHTDLIPVVLSLPNGGLLTGGGKNDATVKVWDKDLLTSNEDVTILVNTSAASAQHLAEPGYIFDACVLKDLKEGEEGFGLACARYNVVQLCL